MLTRMLCSINKKPYVGYHFNCRKWQVTGSHVTKVAIISEMVQDRNTLTAEH